jgi:hypothetical protein
LVLSGLAEGLAYQRTAPGGTPSRYLTSTIVFNINIVNNLNVEYIAFYPTRVVAGFLREST